MSVQTSFTTVRTLDGLHLKGTLVTPGGQPERAAILVHGGGVTREEGGFTAEHELVEIEGAQHGFAVHDDPRYLNPQSQEWQALVIRVVTEWINARRVPAPG